jgi:hypothetical protein
VPNYVTAVGNIRQALVTGFTALPLFWPNDDREPTLDVAPAGFIYSEPRLLDEGQRTLGPVGHRTHRDVGEMAIYVYVPQGTKAGAAEGHAEAIRALFGTTAVPGVIVTRRYIGAGAHVNGPTGRFWAVPVIIEWWSDRTE